MKRPDTLLHSDSSEQLKSANHVLLPCQGLEAIISISVCIVKEKALALSSQPIYSCHDSTAQDLSSVTYPCHVCGRDLACLGEGVGREVWGEVLWVGEGVHR